MKKVMKATGTYWTQSKETRSTFWEFQKEKRKRKGQKVYLKQ